MNALIIGGGGREHALGWKIAASPQIEHIYFAPGNAGTLNTGENVEIDISDTEQMAAFIKDHAVALVIIGPEAPLVDGLAEDLRAMDQLSGVSVIGPGRAGAMLEGSKSFAKAFMQRHHIPTAAYRSFESGHISEARAFLHTLHAPYVLKADGLAAGKGVLILDDLARAEAALEDILLNNKFGHAGTRIVIEEFLKGIELSVFVITDGKGYYLLPEAKDYKRIGEGDTGLNTGGMGAVSPVPFADDEFMEKVRKRIIDNTLSGLQAEGIPYCGFIFFGLIKVDGDPYVIEYNARMGDPETEVVMPRISEDIVPLLIRAAKGGIETRKAACDARACTTVMLVSDGYPEHYEKGKVVSGLKDIADAIPFHAGTKVIDGTAVTNGGRVIACSALGNTVDEALTNSYKAAGAIDFEGKNFRRDIGFDLGICAAGNA